MKFSSALIEKAVESFSSLPGIGKKSALRLVLHLLQQPADFTRQFSSSLTDLKDGIKECERCFNLTEEEVCSICKDSARDDAVICVVESMRDIMAIEETNHFRGKYHVLGGVISPIDGIGPENLNINSLIKRVKEEGVKELIMAISPTIEGETTTYYVSKQIKDQDVNVSTLARGISYGGELEYADEITLGRSISARIPYKLAD